MKNKRINYLNAVEKGSVSVFFSGDYLTKNADATYEFAVNNHFFYLTGINKSKAALVLIKDHADVRKEYLFIERNNELVEKWEGRRMSKAEASNASGFDEKDILFFDEFEKTFESFFGYGRAANLRQITDYYFVLDNKDDFRQAKFIKDLLEKRPNVCIKDAFDLVATLRMTKTEDEVKKIKEAIKITNDGINRMMEQAKEAKTENELEAHYNFVLTLNNVKPSFGTIAASGSNATVLHYHDNNQELNHNDLMLLDLGVSYKGYASDISRTFPLSGKFSKRQKEFYQIVLNANKECIAMIKPGVTWAELNLKAREVLFEGLKSLGLISTMDELVKYYYHSVGHYLGLDVHDVGVNTRPIEVGAVLTIEPGLYIAEEGIGIRIEDDILVTNDGHINLSKSIIKEIEEIETFMSKK